MKQIKAHIAVSLDGHTATLDKELDWLPREIKKHRWQAILGSGLPAHGSEHLQLHL